MSIVASVVLNRLRNMNCSGRIFQLAVVQPAVKLRRRDLPTVARMRGDESPMFWRHSLLMKSDTPLGKF